LDWELANLAEACEQHMRESANETLFEQRRMDAHNRYLEEIRAYCTICEHAPCVCMYTPLPSEILKKQY
jgi:hypothetical protein